MKIEPKDRAEKRTIEIVIVKDVHGNTNTEVLLHGKFSKLELEEILNEVIHGLSKLDSSNFPIDISTETTAI